MPAPQRPGSVGDRIPDLIAGLSAAGLILPEAVAYSGIGNMPPSAGILAACVGLCIYGLLGVSRYALVAATSSSAIVLAAAIQPLHTADTAHTAAMTAALVLLTGMIFLLCGVLRLGQVAHFIARPVIRSLAFGLAIVIVVHQAAALTGIHSSHDNAFGIASDVIRNFHHWDFANLCFGLAALLLMLAIGRWPRLPAPLLVIVLGLFANEWLTAHSLGLAMVGAIKLATPRPGVPLLAGEEWLHLAELAVALTLILFAESYGAIRTVALRHGDAMNTNRDLVALGLANLVSGACQGMPVGAGYSATSANEAAGAQSRAASIVAGVGVAAAAFALLRFVERIPQAVLAAVILYAMRHALSLQPLKAYFAWQRDRAVVAISVLAVLTLGVLDGLLAAIAVSLILLIRGFAQPKLTQLGRLGETHDFVGIDAHADAQQPPAMLILRPEAPLFFANASGILETALESSRRNAGVRAVILSLEETPDLDGTAVEALEQFAAQIQADGRVLLLARLKTPALSVLERAGLPGLGAAVLSDDSVATVVELAQRRLHAHD